MKEIVKEDSTTNTQCIRERRLRESVRKIGRLLIIRCLIRKVPFALESRRFHSSSHGYIILSCCRMVSKGPLSFTQIGMLETDADCRHLAYRTLDGEHDALVSWILIEIRISLNLS